MKRPPTETALIIPVPELDAFVARWRAELEPSPPPRIPAHIAIMYPFLHPDIVGDHDRLIARTIAEHAAFEFELSEVGWFGSNVVYLAPQPAQPFLGLANAITSVWPQCEPYDGRYEAFVPHLTLGVGDEDLQPVAAAVEVLLPVVATANEVCLLEGRPEPSEWRVRQRLPLRTA